jgi:hypothetical protein
MHIREILKRFGMRYTRAYYFNEYFYSYLYMLCRGLLIPSIYYLIWTCESAGPIWVILYPIHLFQNFYYVSLLPKMIKVRKAEEVKLAKAKLTLRWFEPISAEAAKEAGVGSFEAYKM